MRISWDPESDQLLIALLPENQSDAIVNSSVVEDVGRDLAQLDSLTMDLDLIIGTASE
jgi:hypothetical protein